LPLAGHAGNADRSFRLTPNSDGAGRLR
jgi:hypothetical protein